MQNQYYIDNNGIKDGPHDLITVMRRIRTKKILRDTLIYVGDAPSPTAAADIPDIALFFDRRSKERAPAPLTPPSLWQLVRRAWLFTAEHHILTVYGGAFLLGSLLIGVQLVSRVSVPMALLATWCVLMCLQHLLMIFALRLYREQPVGVEFVRKQLLPALPVLLLLSLLLALMMAGGWVLLFVPSLLVAAFYGFAPFLVIDRGYGPVAALHASRLLVQKYGFRFLPPLLFLTALYLLCLALIIPLPLALPVVAAGIIQIYEDLSAV